MGQIEMWQSLSIHLWSLALPMAMALPVQTTSSSKIWAGMGDGGAAT
jgi:hypothetical protein